jgi:hypothetical protein
MTWKIWKEVVAEKVKRREELVFDERDLDGVVEEEKGLLTDLFCDATNAYKGYLDYLDSRQEKGYENYGDGGLTGGNDAE